MENNLEQKVLKTIQKYQMLKKNEKVILAVSGGPDSVVLLDIFSKLKNIFNLSLYILHINHLIRPEAEKEAEFVKKLAQKYNLPFYYYKVNVPELAKKERISLEEAARVTRLKYYHKLLKELKATKIATGHTLDDQAETVLMRLLSGAGPEGLRGIKPSALPFIRPLIETDKTEILKYLKKHKLSYKIDKSNQDIKFTRNKIRHKLLPYLEKNYNPRVKKLLSQTANLFLEDENYFETVIEKIYPNIINANKDKITISVNKIKKLKPALVKRILRRALRNYLGDLKDYTFEHWEKINDLTSTKRGTSKINLPQKVEAVKIYDKIIIQKGKTEFIKKMRPAALKFPGNFKLHSWNLKITGLILSKKPKTYLNNPYTAYLDYEKLKGELIVRPRKAGDKFQPLGLKGTKKIKDFFIDLKIPPEKRDKIPILEHQNKIVWVIGYRIDEKFKITSDKKKILFLKAEKI